MKKIFLTCLIMMWHFLTSAQTEVQKFKQQRLNSKYLSQTELKNKLIKYDFASLFMHTDNSMIYGFIGNNYQRIRIKFIKITKDSSISGTYHVYGRSMVKTYIRDFSGTITISNIRKLKSINYGVDDEYKKKGIKGEYLIIGDYQLLEDKALNHAGVFKGSFGSDFYLDKKNLVKYDDIEMTADGYTNNQFVGDWTDYKSGSSKICNWGDFRIPNSGDLDIGAGEFSPDDKYLKYGWRNVRDLVVQNNSSKKAKQLEEAKWWE